MADPPQDTIGGEGDDFLVQDYQRVPCEIWRCFFFFEYPRLIVCRWWLIARLFTFWHALSDAYRRCSSDTAPLTRCKKVSFGVFFFFLGFVA